MSSSSAIPEIVQNCRKCGTAVSPGTLVCPNCRALVYSNELQQISSHAKASEAERHFMEAHESWHSALRLLPPDSSQAAWIRDKIAELERTAGAWQEMGHTVAEKPRLSVSPFLISFALFIALESGLGGFKFAIGFSVLILIHELGHFLDVKRRGMSAELPIFIPGLGAFVRFRSLNISSRIRAEISLAGPCAGLISAAACAAIWYYTGDRYWAALAQSGAWLNLLNLMPVWALDGGQAAQALNRLQRALLVAAALVVWKFTGERVAAFVAAGAVFRLFFKDVSAKPSWAMTAYFIVLVLLLGLVMYVVPGNGFGIQ